MTNKRGVSLSIDVTKIDKSKLYRGKQGTYLNLTIFLEDDKDQFGNNGMITQSVTEEERKSGVKGSILGNAKIFKFFDGNQGNQGNSWQPAQVEDEGEIPF